MEWSNLLQVVNSLICNEAGLIFHYASDALMMVNILAEGARNKIKTMADDRQRNTLLFKLAPWNVKVHGFMYHSASAR